MNNATSVVLEIQEVGTGKWFPVIIYEPGTESQLEHARSRADLFRDVAGLYVRVAEYGRKEGAAA